MHSNIPEEIRFKKIFFSSVFFLIFLVFTIGFFCISGCQYLPQVADDIEKMVDNDAVTIKCDKDCFQKDTDIEVSVKIINKDKQ